MPKVKTITPGRLSGLSTLTSELASDISQQKEREYSKAVSDWNEEKQKLDAIKEDQLNYIDQKMQLIAGMDQFAGEKFDDTFKNDWMNSVKDYASIVSDIKLGNIDAAEGYMKLAKYDKKLTDLQTAIPNINTLATKLEDGKNKKLGEVGSFIYDGDGKTVEIIELISDLYDPVKNSNVSYQTIDDQDFLVHKNGQKISIPGLNAIMSGNNPDYPISFAESPDEALGQLYDAMWKRAGNGAHYMKETETTETIDGKLQKVRRKKVDISDGSKFEKDLKTAVSPMIDDQDKMRVIWNNIGGDGKWENTEDQRNQAVDLLYERSKDLYGPTDYVISEQETTDTSAEDALKRRLLREKINTEKLKQLGELDSIDNQIEFVNQLDKKYSPTATNEFLAKRESLDDIQNILATVRNAPITEEVIENISVVYPSLRDEEFEDINTPEKLEIVLKQLLGLDNEFFNMQKDYEKYLKNQKNIKSNLPSGKSNLPTLTMEQARKGKKGDQFILKSNGKKYTLVEDQNGKLFGTTTPEKYT